jgi:hypothetical protein
MAKPVMKKRKNTTQNWRMPRLPRKPARRGRAVEQQGQTVEDIMTLVVLQVVGQLALVAQTEVVERGDARNPVAMLEFAVALDVILPAGEGPQSNAST